MIFYIVFLIFNLFFNATLYNMDVYNIDPQKYWEDEKIHFDIKQQEDDCKIIEYFEKKYPHKELLEIILSKDDENEIKKYLIDPIALQFKNHKFCEKKCQGEIKEENGLFLYQNDNYNLMGQMASNIKEEDGIDLERYNLSNIYPNKHYYIYPFSKICKNNKYNLIKEDMNIKQALLPFFKKKMAIEKKIQCETDREKKNKLRIEKEQINQDIREKNFEMLERELQAEQIEEDFPLNCYEVKEHIVDHSLCHSATLICEENEYSMCKTIKQWTSINLFFNHFNEFYEDLESKHLFYSKLTKYLIINAENKTVFLIKKFKNENNYYYLNLKDIIKIKNEKEINVIFFDTDNFTNLKEKFLSKYPTQKFTDQSILEFLPFSFKYQSYEKNILKGLGSGFITSLFFVQNKKHVLTRSLPITIFMTPLFYGYGLFKNKNARKEKIKMILNNQQ